MDERDDQLDVQIRRALSNRQSDGHITSRTVAALASRRAQSVQISVLPVAAAVSACSIAGFVVARLLPTMSGADPFISLPGGEFLLWGVL